MRSTVNLMSGIVLLFFVNRVAFAHGGHQKVDSNSFAHLMAHSWPILIVTVLVFFVLWRKHFKTK